MPTATQGEAERVNGPRSRKGVKTRSRLLDAAKQVFERDGFLDARISDIAEQAGLSHGSFYHYFESKEEIFREVVAVVDEQLSAPLDAVILDPTSTAPPQERIHEAMRRHLESYRKEAKIMGLIEQVSRYDDHVKTSRRLRHKHYQDQMAQSIRQLQRHGLADPALEPTIAAACLGSMTSRFPEMWLAQGFLTCRFDDAVDQLSRLYVNALGLEDGARAARPRRQAAK